MKGISKELRQTVERLHNCKAHFAENIEVKEIFQGETVWEGVVHTFNIEGHPDTDICYAWSSPIEGSDKRKFYAVLKIPPVDSPLKAVQASIVSDYKNTPK
ncbi:MAG: hypothetical protein A2993_02465 [Gammaproteobacteria bacterium RIFCSPLOWO2_01_FULL_47_190]|nr:MAG: hypothetical protein A2993_02465 [Gammaproteobacteria bacterium RIFCSPLOWO2_01_FULL_47_190]